MAVKTPEHGLSHQTTPPPPAALHPEVQKASQLETDVAEEAVGGAAGPPSGTVTQGHFQNSHASSGNFSCGWKLQSDVLEPLTDPADMELVILEEEPKHCTCPLNDVQQAWKNEDQQKM